MTFNCTKCGSCCRNVAHLTGFSEPINADGSCSHLVDNLCSIYETRPPLCRIAEVDFREWGFSTKVEWYDANYRACETLIRAAGLPESLIPMPTTKVQA